MKKLTIRLPDDLHARLVELARVSQRSVNREVIWQIDRAVRGQIRSGLPTELPTPGVLSTDQDAPSEAS